MKVVLCEPSARRWADLLGQNQQCQSSERPDLGEFKQQIRHFVAHEIADIQVYLAAISDRLGIDMGPAVAEKYPVELATGTALKYRKLK